MLRYYTKIAMNAV